MKTLDEILETTPQAFADLGIDHYSPTQLNCSLANWAYKYAVLTSAERGKLKTNIKMYLGTTIGDLCQLCFCDEVYTYNTGELVDNKKKTSFDEANEMLAEMLNKYDSWDQKDQETYEVIRDSAADMFKQAYDGWKSLSMQSPVVAENTVKMQFDYVHCEGRTDGEDPLKFLEQKMKCPSLNRPKKDGTRSKKTTALPKDEPQLSHARQTAFYHFATGKRPFILYANEKEFKIFDSANCQSLTKEGMEEHLQHFKRMAKMRDRLVLKSKGSVPDLLRDLDPDWDHNYEWDIGADAADHAKKVFREAQSE